jgi:hypothetical protein
MTNDSEPDSSSPFEIIDGPLIATYTAHLPFPVCIPNELGHILRLGIPFKDPDDADHFGQQPFVNIRVFDTVEHGLPVWTKGTHSAIRHFYGAELHGSPDDKYGEDEYAIHDQWVTLETPHAALEDEDPVNDPLFSFHRCLHIFNLFLQTALVLTSDVRMRMISAHDFWPVVVIGALQKEKEWRSVTEMYMALGPGHEGVLRSEKPFTEEELNDGLYAVSTNKPYLTTAIWRSRAQRALRQTGDAADAIISFQIAAESMIFDTYRMLLVDEGLSSDEISTLLSQEIPFKTLLTRKVAEKLGGTWDVTLVNTPIGQYWKNLYLVRNLIMHTGMYAHGGQANEAQTAYWALRDHVEERLRVKYNTYPRTLYSRLGRNQLSQRGWLTTPMRRVIDSIDQGPQPYYWPHDMRTLVT